MRKLAIALAAVGAAATVPAQAATTSGTVDVTLNVDNACSLTTAAIDFGSVSDFTAARTANSLSTLKCTPNAVATVTVSSGANVNGTQRRLKSGANFIDYNITDASNAAWPAAGLSFTGTGADVALGIRGVVPVQTAKPAGAYADQVTITVTY
ncbi:MAG: spore coat protein U domain-containing protein [Altererythrobacter sp.]|nr:spore coat protein U domain-containing protein [Altererythrobacter sp.]